MAEGIFKKIIGRKIFVQSAGIFDTLEIDGFTVKVCDEINVKLSKHRVRSLREMEKNGGVVNKIKNNHELSDIMLCRSLVGSRYSGVLYFYD